MYTHIYIYIYIVYNSYVFLSVSFCVSTATYTHNLRLLWDLNGSTYPTANCNTLLEANSHKYPHVYWLKPY